MFTNRLRRYLRHLPSPLRYVRREIRALIPEDQSLFFDVLEIMYRTSWGEGQAKYGNVWRNAGVFARDHNNLAAQRSVRINTHYTYYHRTIISPNQPIISQTITPTSPSECDHMHDGLGFLTTHGALTLDFEKAMQMVRNFVRLMLQLRLGARHRKSPPLSHHFQHLKVDPSVSIPYWDFTIDAHAASESGSIKSWYVSDSSTPTQTPNPDSQPRP